MRRRLSALALLLPFALLVAMIVLRQPFGSDVTTHLSGLRTFSWASEGTLAALWNLRALEACPLHYGSPCARPLATTVRIDPTAAEPVWLERASGERASVIWPAGTHIDLGSPATLVLPNGSARRDGQMLELSGMAAYDAGTFDEPIIASRAVAGALYVYVPPTPRNLILTLTVILVLLVAAMQVWLSRRARPVAV